MSGFDAYETEPAAVGELVVLQPHVEQPEHLDAHLRAVRDVRRVGEERVVLLRAADAGACLAARVGLGQPSPPPR